jgi:hypothetical protein
LGLSVCAWNHADIFFVHLPEQGNGKLNFTIEAHTTATEGSEWILQRTTISAVSPLIARKEADYLLEEGDWGKHPECWRGDRLHTGQVTVMQQLTPRWPAR